MSRLRVRREVSHRQWALLFGTQLGRLLLRRRLARGRRQAMTVLAATTIAGLVVLTVAAERERARQR